MDEKTFEQIVDQAILQLPAEFREALDNVSIIIQEWPDADQLGSMGMRDPHELLGLYQGIPQIERGDHYNLALPDTITLFRKPIEAQCGTEHELRKAVVDTLRHEIAHHFGTDEHTIREIERHRRRARG